MRKIVNPFIVTGKIDPAYFCDREEESARLIRSLDNGNNLVIISPRRMGKTGLIQFCYEKPEWKKTYYTFFIDILHTSSLREFTYTLGKEIYETLLPRSKRMTQLFMQTLKSISGKFGFDPLSNTPTFSLELGDIDRPEYTLDEIFVYLAKADKPCIIAIDEFQQIAKYPEKNIEALLRPHIQRSDNSHFIFAGSERHMMQEMFLSANRPFFQSSLVLSLPCIGEQVYREFANRLLASQHRSIDESTFSYIYQQSDRVTWYVQSILHGIYEHASSEITKSLVDEVILELIEEQAMTYQNYCAWLTENQQMLLGAIAREHLVSSPLSQQFISTHHLPATSSVKTALKALVDKQLVSKTPTGYLVSDRFFAKWLVGGGIIAN